MNSVGVHCTQYGAPDVNCTFALTRSSLTEPLDILLTLTVLCWPAGVCGGCHSRAFSSTPSSPVSLPSTAGCVAPPGPPINFSFYVSSNLPWISVSEVIYEGLFPVVLQRRPWREHLAGFFVLYIIRQVHLIYPSYYPGAWWQTRRGPVVLSCPQPGAM